jgi:hypothetical protein
LALITSLAVIWALRQTLLGKKNRVRDAYYRGMYPLVPFLLVLLVIALQLLPLLIGSTIYSIVLSNGIAVHAWEKIAWSGLFAGLTVITLYLISSSIFALYAVTIPDTTPMNALRSARQLVQGRRWVVIRKLLALPVLLLIAAAIIMLPIILVVTPLAPWIFFLLTMLSLTVMHTYLYLLYRELLHE